MQYDLSYVPGALYSRRLDIHAKLGGQQQGGISTPADAPVVIIFTGEAGQTHGYHDFWDDDGYFHYFGEGQRGDMKLARGNREILEHRRLGKRLILFQMMGKSQPYRYLGEFECVDYYELAGIPDTANEPRTALVFKLRPVVDFSSNLAIAESSTQLGIDSTTAMQLTEVRTKQGLFRRRLIGVEKECRLSGVRDLRFLRASHIKPWSRCATGSERTDGHNGLLLTPTVDLLFDRGWISFAPTGALLRAEDLPNEVEARLGLDLSSGRNVGPFLKEQLPYLEFHRNAVFKRRYQEASSPIDEIIKSLIDR